MAEGFVHFSPGCACGVNASGDSFVDLICGANNPGATDEETGRWRVRVEANCNSPSGRRHD